ncbi:MAG TPA: formate dehydrogenase accessory sulfurtransferase FdhD [Vicinamibacterales bacterium]|jgi:FdhD protein
MTAAKQQIDVLRVVGARRTADVDCAVVEEPLEIRLDGRAFAVIMRTPGADRELAAGFLLAEQVVASADDLGTIEHCTDRDSTADVANIVNVSLTNPSLAERALAERRQTTTNSSCGLCGRRTIESLGARVAPLTSAMTTTSDVLTSLPGRLRRAQSVFDETGGLHAAGLFGLDGRLVDSAEDVGRHNAVDKIVGRRMLVDELPLGESILFVSGRSSFEIVQKALLAGIPIVASVSAPSSLAIELASDMGITLAGFVRGSAFNIYTHPERIAP